MQPSSATFPSPISRVPCQTPAGTTSCTCWPAAKSGPRVKTAERPSGMKLQHLHRIAEIEMKDLVGVEARAFRKMFPAPAGNRSPSQRSARRAASSTRAGEV